MDRTLGIIFYPPIEIKMEKGSTPFSIFFIFVGDEKHTPYEKTIHILHISVIIAIDYLPTAVR